MTFAVMAGCMASSTNPPITSLVGEYDFSDLATITKAYNNIAATGSGTSGTNSITASGTITNIVQAGMILRIGGTDTYTVATASGTAITTVETLSNTYTTAAMALDQISQVNDKSGLGNHLIQTTNSKKPVYTPNFQNGLSVAKFNGANSFVQPSGLFSIPNGNNTVFAVVQRNSETGSQEYIVTLSTSNSARWHLRYAGTAGSIAFWNGAAAPGLEAVKTGNTNTNMNIIRGLRAGINISAAVNGGAPTTSTAGSSSSTINGGFVGTLSDGSSWLIGSVAEIRIYNTALTGKQIALVESQLSSKYNITLA